MIISQRVDLHYFTIGPMYRVIPVVAFWGIRRHPYDIQSKHGTITQICFIVGPASNTIGNRYWVGRATLCVPGTPYRLISDGGGRNMPTR